MANRIVLNTISYHGKGALENIVPELTGRGFHKAFVCSDPDLLKFGVTQKVTDLLDAAGCAKAAREIDELVSEVSGMFAGGSLSEDALDGAMQALTRAYWIAKEKNKKYTPKKYRKEQPEE